VVTEVAPGVAGLAGGFMVTEEAPAPVFTGIFIAEEMQKPEMAIVTKVGDFTLTSTTDVSGFDTLHSLRCSSCTLGQASMLTVVFDPACQTIVGMVAALSAERTVTSTSWYASSR
jgi:hypothetical protein